MFQTGEGWKRFNLSPSLQENSSVLYFSFFPFTLPLMSAEPPAYDSVYIKAWSILSMVVAAILFGAFVLGAVLLQAGKPAWDLIRWLASPII